MSKKSKQLAEQLKELKDGMAGLVYEPKDLDELQSIVNKYSGREKIVATVTMIQALSIMSGMILELIKEVEKNESIS